MTDNNDIDDYIERLVADAPPLTEAQERKLAALLRPVRVPSAA